MNEVKIGVIGSANAAKSSTIGTLTYDVLDDGNGLARSKVLTLPHEKASGRTSSISKHFIRLPESERFVTLVDLAGHEKYLKTTLYGLSGYLVDYAIIIVGANMGVTNMTKEHLGIILPLQIPFIVVVTKIDIAPEHIINDTLNDIKAIITKKRSPQKECMMMDSMDCIEKMTAMFQEHNYTVCPIFKISNITGHNLNLLKAFIFKLSSRFNKIVKPIDDGKVIFKIYDKFYVQGIGIVVSGYVRRGVIKNDDKLFLGPINGDWKPISVRSIHDNFRTVIPQLGTGESGCIAIRIMDKKMKISKGKIKKGVVLSNETRFHKKFEADIYILSSNTTTIKKGYQPMINCNTIVQSAILYESAQEVIRGGEKVRVKLEFMYRPEYIEKGDLFIFREGCLKGFGKIVDVFD